MGITQRFMTASQAFISSWRGENAPPSSKVEWDSYVSRVARCSLFRAQYDNRAYDDLTRLIGNNRGSLSPYTRGVVNPVTRIVDIYPSLCAGGAIDFDALSTGAIPVIGADPTLVEAIIQILLWSNWAIEKSTYVREGSTVGDSVVKVVDYPSQRKVAGEIIPSEFVKDDERDAAGNVKSYVIEYDLEEETSPKSGMFKTYTYRETCDKDWFETFKNGKPFAYFNDANGTPVDRWPNIYGFVPLVIVPHKRMSKVKWGVNAYYHTIPKIDNMNDLASMLTDYLRRSINPSWLANFDKPKSTSGETRSDLDVTVNRRDQERIIYAPESAKMQSLVHPVDVPAGMGYLQFLDNSITKDCPEMSLPQLREGGNLTAPGVQAAFKDGEGRIMEAQANYDNGTVRWVQMAITMAAVRGYDKFKSYNISSYDRGQLAFYIKPRPVVEDKLSKQDEITAWQQSGAPERKVWSLLGATEEEIGEWEAEKQAKADAAAAQFAQQGQQGTPTDPNATGQPNTPPTGNAPAIRGSKLPKEQALKVNPITQDELAAVAAMHRSMKGAGK